MKINTNYDCTTSNYANNSASKPNFTSSEKHVEDSNQNSKKLVLGLVGLSCLAIAGICISRNVRQAKVLKAAKGFMKDSIDLAKDLSKDMGSTMENLGQKFNMPKF